MSDTKSTFWEDRFKRLNSENTAADAVDAVEKKVPAESPRKSADTPKPAAPVNPVTP